MTRIRNGLVPDGTRSLGGDTECSPAVLRRSTHYKDLTDRASPFTAGDLISLAVLWARSHDPMKEQPVAFYRDAYHAVCRGLDIPPVNDLTQVLGIDPEAEQGERWSKDFFRLAGIGRFLWARAHMISLQDPWGNVLEGDIWGQRTFERGTLQYDTVAVGIDAYAEAVNRLPGVLEHIDGALCVLLGWDSSRSVTYADLRALHGMPEEESDF